MLSNPNGCYICITTPEPKAHNRTENRKIVRGILLRDYISYKRQGSFTHDTSTIWLPKEHLTKDVLTWKGEIS
ncbi:mCG148266 [Mus musculus]|jgi:hypothetical protein|nr:mCG148266 [Mus musculus]